MVHWWSDYTLSTTQQSWCRGRVENSEMCGWADDMEESYEFRSCLLTRALSGGASVLPTGGPYLKSGLCSAGAAPESRCSGLECDCGWTAHAFCVKTTLPNWQIITVIHLTDQHLGLYWWSCQSSQTLHTSHLGLLLKCGFCCGGSGPAFAINPGCCYSGITF